MQTEKFEGNIINLDTDEKGYWNGLIKDAPKIGANDFVLLDVIAEDSVGCKYQINFNPNKQNCVAYSDDRAIGYLLPAAYHNALDQLYYAYWIERVPRNVKIATDEELMNIIDFSKLVGKAQATFIDYQLPLFTGENSGTAAGTVIRCNENFKPVKYDSVSCYMILAYDYDRLFLSILADAEDQDGCFYTDREMFLQRSISCYLEAERFHDIEYINAMTRLVSILVVGCENEYATIAEKYCEVYDKAGEDNAFNDDLETYTDEIAPFIQVHDILTKIYAAMLRRKADVDAQQ